MDTSSKFSVLMSVYNGESPVFLRECLDSLWASSRRPDEILLVVDGKIHVGLEAVIAEFQARPEIRFKLLRLEKNSGLGAALSIGLPACTHELVARMDTDDICHPQRFAKQIRILEENSAIDLVGSHILEFGADKAQITGERRVPLSTEAIRKRAHFRSPVNHMTVCFRKTSVLGAGGYLPHLWFEDYHLWVRMLLKGCRFLNVDEHLVFARAGSHLLERRRGLRYLRSELSLLYKFYQWHFLSLFEFLSNLMIRFLVRLLPRQVLSGFYNRFLRKGVAK